MPRIVKVWLFSTLISFTAIGMWKGLEWYYDKDSESEAPIIISAEDLATAYENNDTVASITYDGKTVLMTGVVTNKGDAGAYYTVNLRGNVYQIDLSFNDSSEIIKLADIDIGDTITIRGRIEGLNIIYITISNCSLE